MVHIVLTIKPNSLEWPLGTLLGYLLACLLPLPPHPVLTFVLLPPLQSCCTWNPTHTFPCPVPPRPLISPLLSFPQESTYCSLPACQCPFCSVFSPLYCWRSYFYGYSWITLKNNKGLGLCWFMLSIVPHWEYVIKSNICWMNEGKDRWKEGLKERWRKGWRDDAQMHLTFLQEDIYSQLLMGQPVRCDPKSLWLFSIPNCPRLNPHGSPTLVLKAQRGDSILSELWQPDCAHYLLREDCWLVQCPSPILLLHTFLIKL